MSRRLCLASFALCALLGASAELRAYCILSTNGHDSFRWPTGEPIPWTYDPAGSDDIPIQSLRASLAAAFGAWDEVACADIDFQQEGPAFSPEKGRIHIRFEEQEWDPATQDAAALAETFRNGKGEIIRATLRFNGVDMRWILGDDPFDPFVVDFQGVATHEIGHAVGLAHSRERGAVMYFAGGDTGGRRLDDDDARGLCFLYPLTPFALGQPCDSCTEHTHCAAGSCLFFADEGGFCARDCQRHEDCPDGFRCQPVEGLADQCLPQWGHCDERGGNIPVGRYCYGDATCASNACFATPDSAFCTESCEPEAPESCPEGALCVPIGSTGLCVPPGPLPQGRLCGSHSDCQGTLCIESLRGGVCSAPCGSERDCEAGARCMGQLCVPPGPRPLGALCGSHFDCASQTCVMDEDGEAFCTLPCGADEGPCPQGAVCVAYGPADYCHAVGTQPEGGNCRRSAGCAEGLVCQPGDATQSWSLCATPCDPAPRTPGCPTGELCDWQPLPLVEGRAVGRCVAAQGAEPGQPCGPRLPLCRAGSLCVLESAEEGRCQLDCLVAERGACGSPLACWDLARPEWPGRGVCAPAPPAHAPAPWLPGDPLPTANVLETAPIAIDVVPIERAPAPPSAGGCAVADEGPAPPWPLLLLLLALAARGTKRERRVPRLSRIRLTGSAAAPSRLTGRPDALVRPGAREARMPIVDRGLRAHRPPWPETARAPVRRAKTPALPVIEQNDSLRMPAVPDPTSSARPRGRRH